MRTSYASPAPNTQPPAATTVGCPAHPQPRPQPRVSLQKVLELLKVLTHLPPAGLVISLQLLRGDLEQVRRENPLLFSRGVAISRKLGFPDVIMPGEWPAVT